MSSKELATIKTLDEVLEPLNKAQRVYLNLLLADVPKKDALVIANRQSHTVDLWYKDDEFKAIETQVMVNRDIYQSQALEVWGKNVKYSVRLLLTSLVDKGLDWSNLDKDDKKHVMRAAELLMKLGGDKEKPVSYDEIILRRQRVLDEGGCYAINEEG